MICFRYRCTCCLRNMFASSMMSSRRSRSGGNPMLIVFRRKSRSCRKCPAATSSSRFAFVAEMMRTFACSVFDEPTRSKSPVSITRNSFACWASGMFAISSMKSVLSSASSNRPARSVFASVNAPFTWPNSSLSKSVSDKPPILTVIIVRDARGDSA